MSDKKAFNRRTYGISNLLFLAVIVLFVPANTAYGAPSITYNDPLSDNTTTTYNWVYVNITSNETLNQSILEWGNASGLNNISMFNASLDNLTWFVNMTGLLAGAYNYTVFAQNTFSEWNQSAVRFVTVSAISACQDITVGNVNYILIQNVNSSGTCFNILADNVTIDGVGYTINYSQSETGYAVNNSLGYNRTTIKNLNIVQGNSSVSNAYAISALGMINGTITNNTLQTSGSNSDVLRLVNTSYTTISNNTITTSGDSGYGIAFDSSNSSTLSNNNIMTSNTSAYGIYILSSYSNNITGGSIISTKSAAYYFESADTNNNFRNTNFTSIRNISFADTTSYFNYNNETNGNIWLKTNVSGITTLNRTLTTWSNITMQWNDTNSTAGITANYILTGLLPSTIYYIHNTSGGVQNRSSLTTNSAGALLSFNISLNGNTEVIVDSVPNIIINSPSNNSYYNATKISLLVLNITTNEPAAWCGFSLNGTANKTMDNTSLTAWNYTNSTFVSSDGLYNIVFFCNDSRGNIGTSSTIYFTKDTITPNITTPTHSTPTSTGSTITWAVSESAINTVYYKTVSASGYTASYTSITNSPSISLQNLN